MLLPLAILVGLILCAALARRSEVADRELAHLDTLDRVLASRATPIALGVINALLVWWWMGWYRNPAPMIQDEAAYLLQAELFARGRWTGTAPPLPEFFAQMHVLTEPVLASKYPPGLSLLLTPFVAIGFAALGPMIFAAITGALIFILARRTTTGPVALLTWILWSSGSALLRYQASFLSQTATIPLWLGALYLVLEYRTHHRPWVLVALGACVGALAITRPVTAVALTVPVSVVMMRELQRVRAWRPLGLATLAGIALLAVLPMQNHATTGNWRLSPLVAYSREYTPFDFPGFGYTPPAHTLAPLPPDLDSVRTYLTEARRRHTLSALPATLASRVSYIALDIFVGWRASLLLFALVGALTMPVAGLFALATSATLLLTYAFHAHWSFWTAYYVEGYPAIVFASAAGLHAFARWMIRRRISARLPSGIAGDPRVRAAVVGLCAFVLVPGVIILPRYRAAWQRTTTYQRRFTTALWLAQRESPRSIIFVDYGQNHDVHSSLVWNVPDLASAKTWIAHERGPDDLRLLRLAPERQAYIFRADQGRLTRLPPLAELERIVAMRSK
jgi:hypothetical protein